LKGDAELVAMPPEFDAAAGHARREDVEVTGRRGCLGLPRECAVVTGLDAERAIARTVLARAQRSRCVISG
jgi:hypothetical protein